ncbi:reverse transcriptase [Beauveria bassiana ARSEF 2860]|uniref:Reverse transcriptase n=1 Tax=Beauveria bassiana (strain ARSEF 2860) TaxID=655819 RepID=J5JB78_BEAB2|nr:reverse transcriptase [Beauveria bassiana ARSEF 2860]EJP63378.1 reverse transcriptase [Beauveria bassiana ARSEF 2860]
MEGIISRGASGEQHMLDLVLRRSRPAQVVGQCSPAEQKASLWMQVFSFTLGARTEQNPFSGELAAMAYALRNLPHSEHQNIALFTRNKGAVAALSRPYQQSGQEFIKRIYDSVDQLIGKASTIAIGWDSSDKNKLWQAAKIQAKTATQQGTAPEAQFPLMKSTTLNIERRKLEGERCLPADVGKFSKMPLFLGATHVIFTRNGHGGSAQRLPN